MAEYMSRVEGILLGDKTIVPQSRVEELLTGYVEKSANNFKLYSASDIKYALRLGLDLTEMVGESVTCGWNGKTIEWDIVDYDNTNKTVTLMAHDAIGKMVFDGVCEALAYFENGLSAGNYSFIDDSTTYYFTLTKDIPAGGQLLANTTVFITYESQMSTDILERGTVSTTAIQNAVSLGTTGSETGAYTLNCLDRVNNSSNNFGESGLFQWLNSTAPANTIMPMVTKFSRPFYSVKTPGFLGALDPEFVACLDDTVWKCSTNTKYECPASMGGLTIKNTAYEVTGKIGLASVKEIYGSYSGVDAGDSAFDFFINTTNADKIKRKNDTAVKWWLRSPYSGSSHAAHTVSTTGGSAVNTCNSTIYVVPVCKISKS